MVSPGISSQLKLICVALDGTAENVVGVVGIVVAVTDEVAADIVEDEFIVQMMNVYWVALLSRVILLLVALATAVVVVSELQSAGAIAPDLYAIL